MPKRNHFVTPDDIVYCDGQHYLGAASHGGVGMLADLDVPKRVKKALLQGGKIYKHLMDIMWPVYPNNTGGLLFMRTPKRRVDCILFFAVHAGEGQFLPGLFKYEGPVAFVAKVYWTRKRFAGLRLRLRLPGLAQKTNGVGAGGADVPRVTRDDFMVVDQTTGENRLGCVNFFDDEFGSLEDVIVKTQISEIAAAHEEGDYWAA